MAAWAEAVEDDGDVGEEFADDVEGAWGEMSARGGGWGLWISLLGEGMMAG